MHYCDKVLHCAVGNSPLLELRNVRKKFPGVLALNNVNFTLEAGEVHVLFGENGAGKSTMISLIAGVHQPTTGKMLFNGKPIRLQSVHHARTLGISAVFQEFSLVGQLSVEQNLFLGAEHTSYGFLQRRILHNEAQRILDQLEFPLKATQNVASLSRAEQQMVEIAKAFRSTLSVLILDEPTASLTERESERLFTLIKQVQDKGVGIIYITHRMSEIQRIADRITVLRDGQYIDTINAAKANEEKLVNLITGRVIERIFPKIHFNPGQEMLRIKNLSTKDKQVKAVSAVVHSGEIVGFAGLAGSGKSELLRACFGLAEISAGAVSFDNKNVTGKSTCYMLSHGFFYLPPDRRQEGLIMVRNCRENISLPSLQLPQFQRWEILRRKHERKSAYELASMLQLHPLHIERQVNMFSGGNQQKVMLAKCLTRHVKLYVFDEPTVGVDVGTRAEIYKFLAQLCENGAAVIVISSDLPEVLHLSHRVYVIHCGQVQAELQGADITQENILRNFFDKEVA